MTLTPTEELREAASLLRDKATAVLSEHWGAQPWHVEECSDTDTMECCPCIVAQGEHKEFDQTQIPPIQYVADAETREHAAYIAAMGPGVGLALADWLEAAATDAMPCRCEACPTQAALAVARQLLGGTQ